MSIESDVTRLADAVADLSRSNYQAEIASVLGEIASLLTELVKQHRASMTVPAVESAFLLPLPLTKAVSTRAESAPAQGVEPAAVSPPEPAPAAAPPEPAPAAAPPEPAPAAAPNGPAKGNGKAKGPSFDEVVAIAQEVARIKTPPVAIKLINQHGAQKLAEMDPAKYPAFYAAAQVLLADAL